MATRLLNDLIEDHATMRKNLYILEWQRDIFTTGGHPDWDLIDDIATYSLDYPDLYHHPKEDAVLAAMTKRNGDWAEGA
ncbi:MAG: hypothetical protein EXQ91_04505 [Alphaproteobacteria bacterium]|nr:hypothetical protein [Alphaproteobacteria bacterium]